jgi:hypothetical protein
MLVQVGGVPDQVRFCPRHLGQGGDSPRQRVRVQRGWEACHLHLMQGLQGRQLENDGHQAGDGVHGEVPQGQGAVEQLL